MTQEEKELLIKDLCTRLPYGVRVKELESIKELELYLTSIYHDTVQVETMTGGIMACSVEVIKPYLRPMSSMTEEELKELNEKYGDIAYFFTQEEPYYHGLQAQHSDIGSIEISEFSEIYDWLNAHHFDYRGLIEKGLALEAEDMYETE